nr:MAG TPA: hypothetical protein [Caudoviricetes sp.]
MLAGFEPSTQFALISTHQARRRGEDLTAIFYKKPFQ